MVCQGLGISQLFVAVVALKSACDVLLAMLIELGLSDVRLITYVTLVDPCSAGMKLQVDYEGVCITKNIITGIALKCL